MKSKLTLAWIAAVALCFALAPFARDWFDPIDSLWNSTKGCFPPDEQFDRGMMFLARRHFAERNRRKAEEWLRASASQGYADAQFQLGLLCEELSASDPAEVRKWFEAAAAQGHAEAMARVKEIERKRRIEEVKAQAEFERQRREAEERARLEAERKAREAEESARREREAKAAAEKAEAERKARQEAERKKREHGGVQLWAGGPYWATTNIGAEKPEDYGLYFWWGDTVGYRREEGAWVASDGSSRNFSFCKRNTPTYGNDDATISRAGWITSAGALSLEHDAAHVHWGGGWRMPTKQELDDLGSKCDWTWTTVNGVRGYLVLGRGASAGTSIFLPAAGYGAEYSLDNAGSRGYYWSSAMYSDNFSSWILNFKLGGHSMYEHSRLNGLSVRPVLGFAK